MKPSVDQLLLKLESDMRAVHEQTMKACSIIEQVEWSLDIVRTKDFKDAPILSVMLLEALSLLKKEE